LFRVHEVIKRGDQSGSNTLYISGVPRVQSVLFRFHEVIKAATTHSAL